MANGTDPTTLINGDGHPPLLDRDWETSPMYLALSSRLAKTESTLSSLSAQVSQLSQLVKAALPASPTAPTRPQHIFSPFDPPPPCSSFVPVSASSTFASAESDPAIAALTQQISALSTSVAQLQRLQQSQSKITRQNSTIQDDRTPGHIPHSVPMPRHLQDFVSGSMTTPNVAASFMSPGPIGSSRPNSNRSISSSVIRGNGDGGKWGSSNGNGWTSPGPGQGVNGGMMSRSGSGSGLNVSAPGGAATPGAGIVVTKWEHLNLSVELLRSIAKYGIGPPNKIQTRALPFMLKGSDIIAQAPPTQERIISYVIPALQLCLSLPQQSGPYRGPNAIIVTTTVDQATQCHKLIRNVGGPLGIRSSLAAGAAGSSGLPSEVAAMQRDAPHLLIGTPGKINEVMSSRGGLSGSEVRLLILDEVDQLIARNLHENVLSLAKLLPAPGRGGSTGPLTPGGPMAPFSPGGMGVTSPLDPGRDSPFNPASKTPFPQLSRFGAPGAPLSNGNLSSSSTIERQTCLFSNTVPTDVINFSQSLQVRDPVRVLVRREGGNNSQESVSSVTPGINLKHTYVYLSITGSARSDGPLPPDNGPGTIGSGRSNGQPSEESSRAKEYKLDMLVKMLDDYPLWQAVIHVGSLSMLEAVMNKLGNRQWDTLHLAPDMLPTQKKAVLQRWRSSIVGSGPRFLIVFDVNVHPPEIPWSPLVINFDLPRSVENYANRAAAAVPPAKRQGAPVNGVIVNFVQAAGGDVEMLRSTECAYRFKSAEIPTVFHDLFQH